MRLKDRQMEKAIPGLGIVAERRPVPSLFALATPESHIHYPQDNSTQLSQPYIWAHALWSLFRMPVRNLRAKAAL